MRIIGLIIVLGVVLVLPVSRIYVLPVSRIYLIRPVHIISFVIVFSLGALLLERTSIPTMFKAVFRIEATDKELAAGAAGWARARTYTMAAGWIGSAVGLLRTVRGMIIAFRQGASQEDNMAENLRVNMGSRRIVREPVRPEYERWGGRGISNEQ